MRIKMLLVGALGISALGSVAGAQPAPQTARQALIEMFKTPATFEKHLPEAMQAALHKAGADTAPTWLQSMSLLSNQLNSKSNVHGPQVQTFEAGSNLLVVEDAQAHNRYEITVERDDLQSDQDEIELSFHSYKDGQLQVAGMMPRLTLVMKQEASVWRLNEITVALRVSLSDPELLKELTSRMTPKTSSVGFNQVPAGDGQAWNGMRASNESAALGQVRAINRAETTYAATYTGHGFTCTLSDMGGMGGGEQNEHQAMLLDPRLANGRKNGYVFTVTGCDGTPATRYKIAATPADPNSGARAFCSDESGVMRFSVDGKAATCMSAGQPLQ